MYSPRIPNQQVPLQRPMTPARPSNMIALWKHSVPRRTNGRDIPNNINMSTSDGHVKRSASVPLNVAPPLKHTTADRNSNINNVSKTFQIVESLTGSQTQSLTFTRQSPVNPTQEDFVNLFPRQEDTISMVDTEKNIGLSAEFKLNSAISIIPTTPPKTVDNLPYIKETYSNVPQESVDTIDLTGSDEEPCEDDFFACDVCSKKYSSIETLYQHISTIHKSTTQSHKCNLCSLVFSSSSILNHHKISFHKLKFNSNSSLVIPIFDLNQPDTAAKLQTMGVTSYLPVAQLDNQGSNFVVPIINISEPGLVEGLNYINFFDLGYIHKTK